MRPAGHHAGGAPWIAHWPVPPGRPGRELDDSGAFVLRTCQRELALTAEPAVAAGLARLAPPESYAGGEAYRFLLEVTTGLRSAVPGETNVFGQFRRAWDAHRQAGERTALATLAPLVARLVHDTRAVRHAHLRNLGGASYGSLVRRLLGPQPGAHVLVVGAGELARSLLPYFKATELGIWNRHPAGPAFAAAARLFAPADGATAARWAHHVIMTTPADAHHDERWHTWLAAGGARDVVHLGRRRGDGWTAPPRFAGYDLDDLFDLRRSQDGVRSLQLERARAACRERAVAFAATSPAMHPALRRQAAG